MEQTREQALVEEYLQYILNENKNINLTRITDPDDVMVLHIEDSLVPIDDINNAIPGLYGDLGTGGGFPGVPIAIYSGRKTILVDSVKKKTIVVQKGIELLGLDNQIETYAGRIEELSLEKPSSFAVLTARAVTRLVSLIELASPLLRPEGLLVCYKAQTSQKEIDEALQIEDKVGMKLIRDYKTVLSDNETERQIFVFQKVSKPKVKLPRKIGAAQHSPLK